MIQELIPVMAAGNVGVIRLTNRISDYMNSGDQISKAIAKAIADGAAEIDIILSNCYGGSVVEGAGIISNMQRSSVPVNTKIEGLAASMAMIIFSAGVKREIDPMGYGMTHRGSIGVEGCHEQLFDSAKMLKKVNDQLAAQLAKTLNITKEQAYATYLPFGKDVWLTPDELLASGFATGTWESSVKPILAMADLKAKGPVANFDFTQIHTHTTTPTQMDKILVAAAAGVEATLPDAKIIESVANLVNTNRELTAKVTKMEDDAKVEKAKAIKAFVDQLLADKKITAAEKVPVEALAEKDLEAVKAIYANRAPHVPLKDMMGKQRNANDAQDAFGQKDNESDEAFYERLWKTDSKKLEKLKAEDSARFEEIKAAYVASRA
jgi:ATP-dependent protease ClpP protease subunit